MATVRCSAAGLLVLATTLTLSAQTTFSPKYTPFNEAPGLAQDIPQLQVDLNNDGIPDIIYGGTTGPAAEMLSTGSGNYKVLPVSPNSVPVVAGDFNKDGNADVFFYNPVGGSQLFYIGYGDGKGGFTRKPTPNLPGLVTGEQAIVLGQAADVNGDGRADLLLADLTGANTGASHLTVNVRLFLNNGSGFTDKGNIFTFALPAGAGGGPGNFLDFTPTLDLLLGDFDLDGHADVALRILYNVNSGPSDSNLYILYGDGAGHFTSKAVFTHRQDEPVFAAADMNDDGRTDLVGTDFDGSIRIFKSNAGRTFTESVISANALQNSLQVFLPPVLADLDGNGFKDIAFAAASTVPTSNQWGLRAVYQSPSHTWQLGSFVDADTFNINRSSTPFYGIGVGDYNHDAKPDGMLFLTDSANTHPNSAAVMLNTGSHGAGSCPAPVIGIHVCSPGASSASPVKFSFSATSFYPLRKMEVWVDGAKKSETYHVFANQGFSDVSLSLAAGTHTVSFFSGTYDGGVVKKTITVKVP
jgi:hypothetical protein